MNPRIHTLAFEADEHYAATADSDPGDVTDVDTGTDTDAQPFDFDQLAQHPDFLEFIDQRADTRLQTLLEQAAQDYEQPPDQADLDGYEPNAVQQFVERAIDQRFQQIQPTIETFQEREQQAQIEEFIDKTPAIGEAHGLLPDDTEQNTTDLVRQIAYALAPDLADRYGGLNSPRTTQAALRQAADLVHGYAKAMHQAGYQARNNELKGLSTAREPAPAAVETTGIREEPESVMAAAEQWAARNGRT